VSDIAGILNIGIPILIFMLILGIVVFVHEFGHYIMARRAGIFVEEFAMGMGPKLLEFKGKKPAKMSHNANGEVEVTLYTLRALPLGGFCKMRGMEENIPDDPEAMNNKPLFSRILVIAGGSAMNFLLGIILFIVLLYLTGYNTPIVSSTIEGMPAQQAGLQEGDRITHINGSRVTLWENFMFMLDTSGGRPMDFRVMRDGQRLNFTFAPMLTESGAYHIGISSSFRVGSLTYVPDWLTEYERVGISDSFFMSLEMISFHIRTPFRMIARWLTRQPLPDGAGVMSVVGIGAEVTVIYQEAIQHGIMPMVIMMLFIAGLISVAIGTMNLMPIPALDGARLVFLIIEGIRRKPVSQEREGMVHMVGFVLLMVLLLVVVTRDIRRLWPDSDTNTQYEAPLEE